MKKIIVRSLLIFVTATLLLGALALSSCGVKLVYKDGVFYCSKNKVTYKEVNYQYLPVSISNEVYAELNENGTKTDLFTLENVPPEKWLSTEDGRLFCAVDETVPKAEEMEADSILICREGTGLTISLAEIKSKESIDIVLGNIFDGSELEYPTLGEADEVLSIRLASQKYPWLYYNMTYVEFANDVIVTDYVDDMDTYVYRDVDDSVKVTTVFEYDCWYLASDEDELEELKDIAKNADIAYGTVTKPDGNGGTLEYVGMYFDDCNSLEECVTKVIENYDGSLNDNRLHTLLDYPEMEEKIHVVEYNYGKYLIYDRAMNKCVKADVIVHEYKERIRND